MNSKEIGKIDLNLLFSLHILMQEQSVSRAAKRLHITQPAMSKTLARLRQLFDDPLFTRSSHGMKPTPRALELGGELGTILAGIGHLVERKQFDPFTHTGEVTLALSEFIGLALVPNLTRRLASRAPLLGIRVITRVEDQLEQLALGKLDFAIHVEHAHYGPDYRVEKLGPSSTTLLAREGHPLTQGTMTPERLGQFPLIRPYISDLEQLEIQRSSSVYLQMLNAGRGSLEISHLLTAFEVLRNTDYVMPGPAYILLNEGATSGLCALPALATGSPSISYALVAHNRIALSPLHNWLWDEITCTIRDLRTSQPRKARQRIPAGSPDQLP